MKQNTQIDSIFANLTQTNNLLNQIVCEIKQCQTHTHTVWLFGDLIKGEKAVQPALKLLLNK